MAISITEVNNDENIYVPHCDPNPIFNRANPLISAPACHKIPDVAILDQKRNLIDINVVKEHFTNEGRLTEMQILKIFRDSDEILKKESNLIFVDKKCFIIGDTHGQFYDLLAILDQFDLSKDTLVFLGDYVDRGQFGCEVYLYLLLLKTHYPESIFLLRGNHETERMTTYFTFKSECIHKYSESIYCSFIESFNNLPLAACIQNSAYCCHGGISKHMNLILEINQIDRFREVVYEGLFCDILWSDPNPNFRYGESFSYNDRRRCSSFYSKKDVISFLDRNKLKVVIRGHEVQEEGYALLDEYNNHPTVCTVFSAPNYCDSYQNYGGIVEYDNGILNIRKFTAVKHPFCLPGHVDGINWSYPFVCESILDFWVDLLDSMEKIKIHTMNKMPQATNNEQTLEGNFPEISEELNASLPDKNYEYPINEKLEGTLKNSSMETSETMVEKIVETLENQYNEVFAKNMVLLRTERECIDELEDDDSTLDCCSLRNKSSRDIEFEEASEKDRVNEEAQVLDDTSAVMTIDISPSLLPSTVKSIKAPLDTFLNQIDVVQNDFSEQIIVNNGKKEKIHPDKDGYLMPNNETHESKNDDFVIDKIDNNSSISLDTLDLELHNKLGNSNEQEADMKIENEIQRSVGEKQTPKLETKTEIDDKYRKSYDKQQESNDTHINIPLENLSLKSDNMKNTKSNLSECPDNVVKSARTDDNNPHFNIDRDNQTEVIEETINNKKGIFKYFC